MTALASATPYSPSTTMVASCTTEASSPTYFRSVTLASAEDFPEIKRTIAIWERSIEQINSQIKEELRESPSDPLIIQSNAFAEDYRFVLGLFLKTMATLELPL